MSHLGKLGGWLAAAILALPSLASAQGAITGTVADLDGGALPGVGVEARRTATDLTRFAMTDDAGRFRIPDLPWGIYTVAFTLDGFMTQKTEEIQVSPGQAASLQVKLRLSSVEETITVTGGGEETVALTNTCAELPEPSPAASVASISERPYRSICFLGLAGYSFNAPPSLQYLETEEILFRVDPSKSALEIEEDVEKLGLRGSIEAATVPWSRCMEAELVETTIDTLIRARDLDPATDEPKLEIRPLVRKRNDLGLEAWMEPDDGDPLVRRLGLHATDWRWQVQGIRPGRTQLALRLHAVGVLAGSPPGLPMCGNRMGNAPDSANRVRTLERRLAIEVSAADWVDAKLPSPWLWSLLLPPAALMRAWWRRRHSRPVQGTTKND